MNLNISEAKNASLHSWIGIPKERAERLHRLVKECWRNYNNEDMDYPFQQMLREITEPTHTLEELFFVANDLGIFMAESCKNCTARDILMAVLSGRADIHKINLNGGDAPFTMDQVMKERLKKDMN